MKARRGKSTRTTYTRAWSPRFLELFDLASESWTPPATVRVTRSSRRMTVRAVFTMPGGLVVTAVSRLSLEASGWIADAEELQISATLTGGAA